MSRVIRSFAVLGCVALLAVPADALAVGPQPEGPAPWNSVNFVNSKDYTVSGGICPIEQLGTYQYNGAGVGYLEGPDVHNPYCAVSRITNGFYCAQYNGQWCIEGVFWSNIYWPDGSSSGPRTAVYSDGHYNGYQ